MLYGTMGSEGKYDFSEAKFQTTFAFLRRSDLKDLSEGEITLDHGVFAGVQHYVTVAKDGFDYETHEKYFDVHYIIEGTEKIGVAGRTELVAKGDYDAVKDVTFYEEPMEAGEILLRAGDYVILAPEDAHKPRCAVGSPAAVKKIVVKVPINSDL